MCHQPSIPSGSLRGPEALAVFSFEARDRRDHCLHASNLTGIDAWGAVALRRYVEFHARVRAVPVVMMEAPSRAAARRQLFYALGHNLPGAYSGLSPPPEARPTGIILPATTFRDMTVADDVVAFVVDHRASGLLKRPLRLIGQALTEAVANARDHGASSLIDPIGAIFVDREAGDVELVVSDLGKAFDDVDPTAAADALLAAVAREQGALTDIVEQAERRGFRPTATVVAGIGRVRRTGDGWVSQLGTQVAGFTFGLKVTVSR